MAARVPTVTTLAGTGAKGFQDGPGATAILNDPCGIVSMPDGTVVFSDFKGHRIRRYNPVTRETTTIAGRGTAGFQDGPGDRAMFNRPSHLAVDADGNVLVADYGNHRIRRLDMATMIATTLAGSGRSGFQDGPADAAMFSHPVGLAVDADGNVIIGDTHNHRICRYNTATRHVTTRGFG